MRLTRPTSALLVAALLATACGGDDDLATPIAEDVRGARIDAAPGAAPLEVAEAPAEVATQAPEDVPEQDPPREIEPEVAQPEETQPAAAPGTVAETDTGTGDGAEQEQVPDLVMGDEPRDSDQPVPPPVEEPTAAGDAATDEQELPDPGDDWEPEPPKPPVLIDGEWNTSFDYLGSFDVGMYALDESNPLAQHTPKLPEKEPKEGEPEPVKGFPDEVRAMDGQKVRIEGYMIPLKFEDGAVKTFFLSRYMMGCCFGMLPKANEIIEVQMLGEKGAYYDAYMPFVVVGTFEIVEEGTSPDFLQSVFRIQADSADYAEDW
jgi:hypothetical protein